MGKGLMTMTRNYELTVVFSPQLNEKDLTAATTGVEKAVEKAKGKLGKMAEWGKKGLAYPIKKETEGVFRFWPVELPGEAVTGVDKELRLVEGVLRFLLVGGKPHGHKVAK